MKRIILYAAVGLLVAAEQSAAAGNGNSVKNKMAQKALPGNEYVFSLEGRSREPLTTIRLNPTVGTYTTLEGFMDYQTNTGACQYIRVDRTNASGNLIHVVFMSSSDSTDPSGSTRRTSYAYSTNGGQTWNNFSSVTVPSRRSGYPSSDLLQGATSGLAIANHNDPGTGLQSGVFVDSPPGTGAFSELSGVPLMGGDEPIWPGITSTSDGSIVLAATRSTANTMHYTRSTDFTTWAPWGQVPVSASAGSPVKASGGGRVAILVNTSFGATDTAIGIFESTDNGATWPSQVRTIAHDTRIVGPDTFSHTLGTDFVYNGNNLCVTFAEYNAGSNAPTDSAQILFWSEQTGVRVAASKVNTPNITPFENRATLNAITLDMPAIGISGNVIVIAYQGMILNDTSTTGYNNNDIFVVFSNDGGQTWTNPTNVTNTRGLDERFVSVAPWNEPGKVNLAWQEDPEAGGNIIGDPDASVRKVRQVFVKLLTTDVQPRGVIPSSFTLGQNYPNPFNPATKIGYTIGHAGQVSIKVYNTLGQEVASILNEQLERGTYQAVFDGAKLPSGVYFYRLLAPGFAESKRMVLLK